MILDIATTHPRGVTWLAAGCNNSAWWIFWCVHRNMPMTLTQLQIFILWHYICTSMYN